MPEAAEQQCIAALRGVNTARPKARACDASSIPPNFHGDYVLRTGVLGIMELETRYCITPLLHFPLRLVLAFFDLFDELGNDFENVADNTEVGVLKDRRLGVFIDRNDELGGFHS